MSGQAAAQDQSADLGEFDDLVMEEVTVTGSRIRRANLDNANPVTVLTREEIELSGMTDVGVMLQRLPAMSGAPANTTRNSGGSGNVRVDLRGMGSGRTLTLVNGRRMVSNDMQTIPSTMVERIEILKDGASAIYGADAVAGVVNIITRRDFDGIELSAQHSDWQHSRGMQNSVGLIAGKEWDSGNFVFGAEYVDQEEAYQRDTPWSFLQNTYYIYPEGCENQVAAPYDGTPQGGCYPYGSSRIPEGRLQFYSQGRFLIGDPAVTPYEVGLMARHDGRQYNYAPVNYLQTPYKKTNIFTEGHFELTENVRFNMEFRASFRESAQQFAPLPLTGGDPMHDGTYVDPDSGESIQYTGVSQDNYYLQRAVDAYNAANGTSLIYEPLIEPRRRMIEVSRREEQAVTQYQWTAGLEGLFREMNWEVYLNQGIRNFSSLTNNRFAGDRLHNALGPSADRDGDGQPECYGDINDPASLIPGCVPLNLFGGGSVDEYGNPVITTVTPDMIDYLAVDTNSLTLSKQRTAGASLTGSHFQLPGGELSWAIGWSYWKQELSDRPDSSVVNGAVTGNDSSATAGSLTNNAIFGEFLAPLYENGIQSVYLKGGLRYDHWSQFDSDTTYQLGIEFQALESLKLRATYGTVFRVPTITSLYTGLQDSFISYSDPCIPPNGEPLPPGCAQVGIQEDSQLLARVGGNPNLQPEKGDTFTAGFVWTPQFGDHGLTLTVDYWDITLEDAIAGLGVQFILDECYINLSQQACALITRNPDYSINQVVSANLNVGFFNPKGVDTEIRWNFPARFGLLQASFLWTHILEWNEQAFEGSEVIDWAGTYITAQDKANLSLQWMLNDWSVSYFGEYIGSITAETFFDPSYLQDIPSALYHDLTASYTFGAAGAFTQLTVGIRNLTNEAPPFIEIGTATTDVSTYRLFGRGYYINLKWAY